MGPKRWNQIGYSSNLNFICCSNSLLLKQWERVEEARPPTEISAITNDKQHGEGKGGEGGGGIFSKFKIF